MKFLKRKIIKWIMRRFIPKGPYCDGCSWWRPNIAPIEIGDRDIAYCIYLDKTDLDLCKEKEDHVWECRRIKEDIIEKSKGKDLPLSFSSMLWDGCKECNIKDDLEDLK